MTLFEFALARHTDPKTSMDAVTSLTDRRLSRMMQLVLEAIEALGGSATIEEVAEYSNLSLVSVSPRFKPLKMAGKIFDSGERRINKSGRSAIVWSLNNQGGATA